LFNPIKKKQKVDKERVEKLAQPTKDPHRLYELEKLKARIETQDCTFMPKVNKNKRMYDYMDEPDNFDRLY
jgi:hypothetical protein